MGRIAKPNESISIPHTLGAPSEDALDLIGAGDDTVAGGDELPPGGDDLAAGGDELDYAADAGGDTNTAIAELRGQLSTITSMLQRGATGADAAAANGTPGLNLEGLPDPVTHKADFNRELATRLSRWTAEQSTQMRDTINSSIAQHTNANQATALEASFATRYPDLAKRRTLMTAAVQDEVNSLRARNRDPRQILLSQPDVFMAKVAKRMRLDLGLSSDDTTPEGRDSQRRAGRTAGVGTGSRSAGGQGAKQSTGPKGFVAELKEQQKQMGLY